MTNEEKEAIRAFIKRDIIARARDEWCSCGHERTKHEDTLAWGHGDCLVDDCDCDKFTWVSHKEDRS